MNNAEWKIKQAFEKAAELHRQGSEPNDAIIKAAEDHSLNPEMTRRVVEMFNISKTNSTLKTASDKTATFPIAEAGVILDKVFRKSALVIADEGAEISVDTGDDFVIVRKQQKVASERPTDEVNMDVSAWLRETQSAILDANNKLAAIGVDRLHAETQSKIALSEMVEHFATTGNIGKWAAFEGEVLSLYGDEAKSSLDMVYDLACPQERRFDGEIKTGSFYFFERQSIHDSFDRFAKHVDDYVSSVAAHQKAAADLEQNVQQTNTLLYGVFDITAPRTHKVAGDLLDFSRAEKKASPFYSPVHQVIDGSTSGIQGSLGGQFQQAHEHALKQVHQGPRDDVDLEKDNIRRQAILQELMANDENLVGANPESIRNSYNVLLHLAPDATLNHGVTQSFLRSALAQQTVDPFTAKQIADLQKTILQNKQLASGKAVPMAS